MSVATYSFLPFLRQGIANTLKSDGGSRGELAVQLVINGDAIAAPAEAKTIEIYGPGDVVGIDPRSVIKTDPHNWITNFEPNYLACIDFYDEDLPWRYTPVPAAGQRLNPWISLVVLAEGEFEEGQNLLNRPLPFFKLKSDATRAMFPKVDQLWAWAHVHFNGDLSTSDATILTDNPTEVNKALDKLQSFLDVNPDFAYSRLVCPRKLQPNVSYHAFVIPSYESGRLAGTGADASAIAAAKLKLAWQDASAEYPYYYRWKFNTGDKGDFEYLVGLLKPKVADSRVGRRVMDMTTPKANLVWVEDTEPANQLGGILRLGGALKVPEESLTAEEIEKTRHFDQWAIHKFPELHPFQQQIAAFLNLANDYQLVPASNANAEAETAGVNIDPNDDADPLITAPIYGKWHAMVERVYKDRDGNRIDNNYNWLNELNLDPRFRVPAHFGTRVVQENQEDMMQAAWEQIGEVLAANRQIRYGQFSIASSAAMHAKHFMQAQFVTPSKTVMLTAPLQKRIMLDNVTVFHAMKQTMLPNAFLSAPMRRIVRPRGRVFQQLQKQLPDTVIARPEELLSKISSGEILPAPPKILPTGVVSVDTVAGQLVPRDMPAGIKDLLKKYPWLPYAAFAAALLLIIILFVLVSPLVALVAGIALAGAAYVLYKKLIQWQKDLQTAESFRSENKTPASVGALPKSTNFKLVDVEENTSAVFGAVADGPQLLAYKDSLKDMYRLFQLTAEQAPVVKPLIAADLTKISAAVLNQVKPEKTVPAWTWQHIFFPSWIKEQLEDEGFVEAMAYPKINTAMYEPLKKISDELFLPNIELIEQNSITLLETNQSFIESYMVGLNHEFARELLWREYPTDQRGSYFRQFWDVSQALKDPALKGKTEAEQREPYYDIPKLHEWKRKSKLGSHDNRQKPGEPPREEVVLVIRGELLKKYPTAVVYAHKAAWSNNDVNIARSLSHAEEGDKEKPDTKYIRTPLYSAKADPDIYFFGFDLSVPEVKGENSPAIPTDDNAGWFFVIKERAGEPRFGLDEPAPGEPDPELVSWNDLNWKRVVPGDGVIDVLTLPPPPLNLGPAPVPDGNTETAGQIAQHNDDIKVPWNNNIDAGNLAYILYQVPMMVAVHADDMLLKK